MANSMYSPETQVVAAGRPEHLDNAPVNTPIQMTSTYYQVGPSNERTYARFTNQSWDGLEEVIGQLEGATLPGLLFSSGMAAIASIQHLLPVGSTILIPAHAYMASVTMASQLEARGITRVVRFDIEDTDALVALLEATAADYQLDPQNLNYAAPQVLLWLESPTNPMMEVADLPTILAAARRLGIVSAVDNTFATPLGQNPLALGADVVVHSATKSIAGHSDVILGMTVTSSEELRAAMLAQRTTNGAIAGPFEAWLGLRGVRTLALRVAQANASALELARRLQDHPAIREVRYPGLESDPGHERAKAQMKGGFGSVLCIVLDASADETDNFLRALKLWTPATSLGGVESLIERRRRHGAEPHSIPESLVRMSVGIENVEDLYRDVVDALAAIGK